MRLVEEMVSSSSMYQLISMHSCPVHVTIFNTCGKFPLVSNFTLAVRSYALLLLMVSFAEADC